MREALLIFFLKKKDYICIVQESGYSGAEIVKRADIEDYILSRVNA